MTWPGARDALYQIPRDLNYETWNAPPPELPNGGPYVLFTPPGRSFERRPGSVRWGTYGVTLYIYNWVPNNARSETVDAIAATLDDTVEAISTALDGAVKLGGEAVNATPPRWQDATLVEYPADSGKLYLVMQCDVDVTIAKESAGFAP